MLSIIFPFRYDSKERVRNLRYVLDYYRKFPNVEIIIVEQCIQSQLPENIKKLVRYFRLRDNEQFNRGKCFNFGAQVATHNWLMFIDVDCLLSLIEVFQLLSIAPGKSIILPKKHVLFMTQNDTELLIQQGIWGHFINTVEKASIPRTGGVAIFRHDLPLIWAELYGWGCEDHIMDWVIEHCIPKNYVLQGNSIVYHLWHPTGYRPHKRNDEIYEEVKMLSIDELSRRYFNK